LKTNWPNAKVEGFDVSRDAVAHASKLWPGCRFVAGAIRPDTQLTMTRYDLIVCQEFYPFTRTASVDEHEKWLTFVATNLSEDGIAMIAVTAANYESINATFGELRQKFNVRCIRIAVPKLSRLLPLWLSRAASIPLRVIRPSGVRNVYVLRR